MDTFLWDEKKEALLLAERGVSFDEIVLAILGGALLDIVEHSDPVRYPGQRIAIVELRAYAYLVPYLAKDGQIILKTIIPSRKATRRYLGEEHHGRHG